MEEKTTPATPLGPGRSVDRKRLTGPVSDGWTTAALFAAALLLYVLTFQVRVYGDGKLFVPWLAHEGRSLAATRHPLYLFLGRGLLARFPGLEPGSVLRWLSAFGAALAVALVWSTARGLGTARRGALVAACLLALAPATWFFATTVELHALHMGMVALLLWALVRAPWHRPRLAYLIAAVPLPLVLASHMSGALLLPGWLLAGIELERRARGENARPLGRSLGSAVFAVSLAAIAGVWLSVVLREVGPLNARPQVTRFLVNHFHWPDTAGLGRAWLGGLGLLVPAALVGAYRLRTAPGLVAAGALLSLPYVLFFLVWGPVEAGAYTLGAAPVLALFAAHAAYRPRHVRLDVAALLLLGQLLLAWPRVVTQDALAAERVTDRAALVRDALGEEGILISLERTRQPIEDRLPGILELNLVPQLRTGLRFGTAAQALRTEFLAFVLERTDAAERLGLPIALDLGYREWIDGEPGLAEARRDFENALRAAVSVEVHGTAARPLWVLASP